MAKISGEPSDYGFTPGMLDAYDAGWLFQALSASAERDPQVAAGMQALWVRLQAMDEAQRAPLLLETVRLAAHCTKEQRQWMAHWREQTQDDLPHLPAALPLRRQQFPAQLQQLDEGQLRLQVEHPVSQLMADVDGFHCQPMGLLPQYLNSAKGGGECVRLPVALAKWPLECRHLEHDDWLQRHSDEVHAWVLYRDGTLLPLALWEAMPSPERLCLLLYQATRDAYREQHGAAACPCHWCRGGLRGAAERILAGLHRRISFCLAAAAVAHGVRLMPSECLRYSPAGRLVAVPVDGEVLLVRLRLLPASMCTRMRFSSAGQHSAGSAAAPAEQQSEQQALQAAAAAELQEEAAAMAEAVTDALAEEQQEAAAAVQQETLPLQPQQQAADAAQQQTLPLQQQVADAAQQQALPPPPQ
ncbi:hypothetical protein C2E20_9053 isoform B [Micractinium conductrix]|uniref:Uncharacterized protein n=1 Tax=Micractinium conductrix TaxID=554055 RepID=A0A2P6UZI2_9CHLO|nr:hypothetical protein C2E20_9053 isoform B [Micractinium conductrix]|eukprot:PSC67252.1 hypothetical protein C2E20_9053 isoform B [Micractinium conductrix]